MRKTSKELRIFSPLGLWASETPTDAARYLYLNRKSVLKILQRDELNVQDGENGLSGFDGTAININSFLSALWRDPDTTSFRLEHRCTFREKLPTPGIINRRRTINIAATYASPNLHQRLWTNASNSASIFTLGFRKPSSWSCEYC